MAPFISLLLAVFTLSLPTAPTAAQTAQKPQLAMTQLTEVKGASWSPNGARIVSWEDGNASLWDGQTGKRLFMILHGGGFVNPFYGPTWDSNMHKMLSWQEKKALIWNASDGTLLQTLDHEQDVDHAVWSSSGKWIASWSSFFQTNPKPKHEIQLFIWDSASGQQVSAIQISGGYLQSVKWSPDDRMLMTLSTGDGGGIYGWNPVNGTAVSAFNHPGVMLLTNGDIAWSKDNSRILVSGVNGKAYVADGTTGGELASMQNDGWIWNAYWNPDNSKILGLLPYYRVAYIWDAGTGDPLITLRHEDYVINAIWNSDGSRILTTTTNGFDRSSVNIWDAANGKNLLNLSEPNRSVSAAWDVTEHFILGWLADTSPSAEIGTWKVWDATTGSELLSGSQTNGTLGLMSPLWSPTESRLLTWKDSTLQVWAF